MSYKDVFYRLYVSSHHVPRKGAINRQVLEDRVPRWEKMFRRFLPPERSARIIDLGCGYGAVVWWLRRAGYENAEGIDISVEQIQEGRALGVEGIQVADLRTYLVGQRNTYDVVLGRDILEHFDKSSVMETLRLVRDSLKPGGVFVLHAPNAESPFFGRIRYGDFTHDLAFTSASIGQLFRVMGFSSIQAYPVEPVIFGLSSFVRLVLWRMVAAFYRALITVEMGRGDWIVSQNLLAVARK